MIPNQWCKIAEPSEIKADALKGSRRMGDDLVLWRNAIPYDLIWRRAQQPSRQIVHN